MSDESVVDIVIAKKVRDRLLNFNEFNGTGFSETIDWLMDETRTKIDKEAERVKTFTCPNCKTELRFLKFYQICAQTVQPVYRDKNDEIEYDPTEVDTLDRVDSTYQCPICYYQNESVEVFLTGEKEEE